MFRSHCIGTRRPQVEVQETADGGVAQMASTERNPVLRYRSNLETACRLRLLDEPIFGRFFVRTYS